MKNLLCFAFLAVLGNGHTVRAQETLPLYEGKIPGAIEAPDQESLRDAKETFPFLQNISRPTITIYLLKKKSPVPAVLIFPGGSYRGVSIEKEGHAVARAFNKMGIAAFVVKYRSPNDTHMNNRSAAPLQDAQQAMRMVRSRAAEWNLDSHRIGVVGFSAGGHLAATAALRFDEPIVPPNSAINLRPDFAILLYPVISMTEQLTHAESRRNLLGENPSNDLVRRFSMELTPPKNAPPIFLVHAADDGAVRVENTLRLFDALHSQQTNDEMHVYPHGGHGFGLENSTTRDRWIDRCQNWLLSLGILPIDQ